MTIDTIDAISTDLSKAAALADLLACCVGDEARPDPETIREIGRAVRELITTARKGLRD